MYVNGGYQIQNIEITHEIWLTQHFDQNPTLCVWDKKYMKQNFLILFTLIALRSYAEP